MAQHHIHNEQRTVAERKHIRQRRSSNPHIRQHRNTRNPQPQRHQIPPRAHPRRRQCDRPEELDRPHRAQRDPRNGLVKDGIHRAEHHAQRNDQPSLLAPEARQQPPRPAPHRKHHGCRHDPQPRDAERRQRREQQHRERRPQIVEHRADQEIELRRNGLSRDTSRSRGRLVCAWGWCGRSRPRFHPLGGWNAGGGGRTRNQRIFRASRGAKPSAIA